MGGVGVPPERHDIITFSYSRNLSLTKRKATPRLLHRRCFFWLDLTYLSRHDTLSFCNEAALGTGAALEATLPLVPLEPGDDSVVPAAGALGPPGSALRCRVTPAAAGLGAR